MHAAGADQELTACSADGIGGKFERAERAVRDGWKDNEGLCAKTMPRRHGSINCTGTYISLAM